MPLCPDSDRWLWGEYYMSLCPCVRTMTGDNGENVTCHCVRTVTGDYGENITCHCVRVSGQWQVIMGRMSHVIVSGQWRWLWGECHMSLCLDSDRWFWGECHMSLCPVSDSWSTMKYEGRSENSFHKSFRPAPSPLSPIFNEYQGSLTGVKRPGCDVTTHRHLAPRLRRNGAISVPSWRGQEQLYL